MRDSENLVIPNRRRVPWTWRRFRGLCLNIAQRRERMLRSPENRNRTGNPDENQGQIQRVENPRKSTPRKKICSRKKIWGESGSGLSCFPIKKSYPRTEGGGGLRQVPQRFDRRVRNLFLSPVEDYEYTTEHRRRGFIIGNRRFSFRFQGSETDILTDNERERLRNREESGHLRSETRKTMSFFIKNHAFFAENHAFFAIKKDRKFRPE